VRHTSYTGSFLTVTDVSIFNGATCSNTITSYKFMLVIVCSILNYVLIDSDGKVPQECTRLMWYLITKYVFPILERTKNIRMAST
jgi:hypothetical protein